MKGGLHADLCIQGKRDYAFRPVSAGRPELPLALGMLPKRAQDVGAASAQRQPATCAQPAAHGARGVAVA